MLLLLDAYQEVVGLDIPMQKSILVHKFNPLQHLYRQHQHCFQGEFAPAVLEQVFQAGPQQVNGHDIVVTLEAKVMDFGQADCAVEYFVQFGLIIKLRKFRLTRFQLYSDLVAGL